MKTYEEFKATEFNLREGLGSDVFEKADVFHRATFGVSLEEEIEKMSVIAYRFYQTEQHLVTLL